MDYDWVCIGRYLTRESNHTTSHEGINHTSNSSWDVVHGLRLGVYREVSHEGIKPYYISRGNETILQIPREKSYMDYNWVCIGRYLTRKWSHTLNPSWHWLHINQSFYLRPVCQIDSNMVWFDPSWDVKMVWFDPSWDVKMVWFWSLVRLSLVWFFPSWEVRMVWFWSLVRRSIVWFNPSWDVV